MNEYSLGSMARRRFRGRGIVALAVNGDENCRLSIHVAMGDAGWGNGQAI